MRGLPLLEKVREMCYTSPTVVFNDGGLDSIGFWPVRDHSMLTPKQKAKLIGEHRTHEKDTGSPESQIALFSAEIEALAKHLKKHAKDNSSRVGLLKMVAKRKRLLDYLKRTDEKRHGKLVAKLGLKK